MRVCAIAGCDREVWGHGWCQKHYTRWRRTGDPTLARVRGTKPKPWSDRIKERSAVDPDTGCWLWDHPWADGYGYLNVGSEHDGSARTTGAHRVAYEAFRGSIPEGLHVDHLCDTTSCVNPDHLEVVSQAENNRRAQFRRTTCSNGHPWDEANTYLRPAGTRECRQCRRDRESDFCETEPGPWKLEIR